MANKIAGIDVHKKVVMVVVLDGDAPGEKPERRRFSTMPTELHHLATWLRERGVEEASTAQYWRSVWLELEPHMSLHLAQAFSNELSTTALSHKRAHSKHTGSTRFNRR